MNKHKEKINKKGISRRDFIKSGIGGTIGFATLGSGLMGRAYVYGAEKPPIKILSLSVVSGVMADFGTGGFNALKIFAKQVNEAGGILGRKVEIIHRDSAGRPEIAVREFRRGVLEDKADFMIMTDGSGVILALCPVGKELKTLWISGTAGTPKFQQGVCNRYSFRAVETAPFSVYAVAKISATREPHLKRWAGINPDYEWGHVGWEYFQKYLKKLNPDVEFVGNFFSPYGSADFRPYISRLLDLKPDGVFTSLWTGELTTFIKQAKMYDFFKRIKRFIDGSTTTLDASMALGNDMEEMFGTCFYFCDYPDTPENRKFVKHYRELTGGGYPLSSSGSTYKASLYLKGAIEKAGTTDTEKVADALSGLALKENIAGGRCWMRPKDHQDINEYVIAGKTGPDPRYPFWIFKELLFVQGTEFYPIEDPIIGCK
jgi:branched-chain amino acid transport system substrate-binding protein